MALWVCSGCSTGYSVDAPHCPNCGADEPYEQGDESMAKITRHGGFTNAAAQPGERGYMPPGGTEEIEGAERETTEDFAIDALADDGTTEPDTRTADEVVATESVDGVKRWVDGDAERALAALEAEQETVSPRTTLVAALEALVAAGERDAEPMDELTDTPADESAPPAAEPIVATRTTTRRAERA